MKEVPDSMVLADDVVLCVSNEVDMTEYLKSWRKALEEREMNVRHAVDKQHRGCRKIRASGTGVTSIGVFSRVTLILPKLQLRMPSSIRYFRSCTV